jgi:hypothetical protein
MSEACIPVFHIEQNTPMGWTQVGPALETEAEARKKIRYLQINHPLLTFRIIKIVTNVQIVSL